ncbi:MAG: hypothetical protein ABL936_04720 [Aestuariivirga sp.]
MATKESAAQQVDTSSTSAIEISELEKTLESLSSATFHEIGIDYHSTKGKRSLQLLGNKDATKAINSRHDWFGYEFKELIYLSSVEASTDGFGEYDDFELSYIDAITGVEKLDYARTLDGKVKFTPGKFVMGFGFRPPSKWSSPKLLSIDAYGLIPSEINNLVDQFVQAANIRDRVLRECQMHVNQAAEADTRKTSLEDEISNAEKTLEAIKADVESANSQILTQETKIGEQVKEIEGTNSLLAEKQTTISALEDQIEKRSEERKSLNHEVTLANNRLSELKRDIHLFPSEIAGYVKQGARNIWLYLLLSLIPFGVICAVTYRLFSNSESLLNAFLSNPNVPIIDYLLSRLPYAAVSVVILTVCYTLMHRLFAEIIGINRKKQDLFKISIVATDVSFASQQGLSLDEETSYNLRTQTKMELLKEHLRQHLPDDYVYGKGFVEKALELARAKLERKVEGDDNEVAK